MKKQPVKKETKKVNMSLNEKVLRISMQTISVERTGKIHSKNKSYHYATLPNVQEALFKPLLDMNLAYKFNLMSINGKAATLKLNIYDMDNLEEVPEIHSLVIEAFDSQSLNQFMVVGGGITYYKRYLLSTAFNLKIEDEDTDTSDIKQIHKKILLVNTPEYRNVQDALNNGKKISDIEEVYILTDKIKKLLDEK